MCRLALYQNIQDAYDLACGITQLDLSMGGDGMGYYETQKAELSKSVGHSPTEIARATTGKEMATLFHARLSSVGGVSDEICHPFEVDGEAGCYVVAHNGHWSDWYHYQEYGLDKTDTQCAARLVAKYGPGVLLDDAFDYSGMWLVVDQMDDRIYHIRRSGSFYLQPFAKKHYKSDEPRPFFHASEPVWAFKYERQYAEQLPPDMPFFLLDNGKATKVRNLTSVKPERKRWFGGGKSLGAYGYGNTWEWSDDDRQPMSDYELGVGLEQEDAFTYINEEGHTLFYVDGVWLDSKASGYTEPERGWPCVTQGCDHMVSSVKLMRCHECQEWERWAAEGVMDQAALPSGDPVLEADIVSLHEARLAKALAWQAVDDDDTAIELHSLSDEEVARITT